MGSRKHNRAERLKEERKSQYFALLRNNPISPRKMRLVADLVRGHEVNRAMDMLRFSKKHAAKPLEKLLLSAVANWQAKNENSRLEDNTLYVTRILVDAGRTLKRLQPAPQGRAHRIVKRSNHVTVYIGPKADSKADVKPVTEEITDELTN